MLITIKGTAVYVALLVLELHLENYSRIIKFKLFPRRSGSEVEEENLEQFLVNRTFCQQPLVSVEIIISQLKFKWNDTLRRRNSLCVAGCR